MPTQGCWGRRTPGQAALTLEVVPAGGTQRQHAFLQEEPASASPWDLPSPASLHLPCTGTPPLCPRIIPQERSERCPQEHPQDHPQNHPRGQLWGHPWGHSQDHSRTIPMANPRSIPGGIPTSIPGTIPVAPQAPHLTEVTAALKPNSQ